MTASDQDRTEDFRRARLPDEADSLPFSVEITDGTAVERTLARAATASLAQAIFNAARTDYPLARVVLMRGAEIVIDSDEVS